MGGRLSCGLCEEELRYSGYENYPTWCVVTRLINDPEMLKHWMTIAIAYMRQAKLATDSPDYLTEESIVMFRLSNDIAKTWITLRPLQKNSGLYADLLQYTLQQVNWQEVAQVFIERAREKGNGDGK